VAANSAWEKLGWWVMPPSLEIHPQLVSIKISKTKN